MTTPAFARGKKKATPLPTPYPTTITAVTADTVTVTDQQTTRALTVTPFTDIFLDGQKATVAQLKPGMKVSVVLASTPTQARRLTVTSK